VAKPLHRKNEENSLFMFVCTVLKAHAELSWTCVAEPLVQDPGTAPTLLTV
jgi:hypothetical protein